MPHRKQVKKEANPLEMLFFTLLAIVAIGYGVIALSTGNPLWLVPAEFTARPAAIEIHHVGETVVYEPGDPEYERLVEELNTQMNQIVRYHEHGYPQRALQETFEGATSVVFIYASPLEIRTHWNLGEPNHLLIPVTGAGSRQNRVYTGTDSVYGHGALVVEDLSGLYSYVRDDLGFRQ